MTAVIKSKHPAPETGSKRAETRQRILDAAGRLFRAHGVDGIGIDAVMKEAGLTHGGFYLHFPSKEALAAEVAQSLLQSAARRWAETGAAAVPEAALRQIVGQYLDADRVAAGKCCMLTMLGPDVARRPASRDAIGGALRSMLDTLSRCLPDHAPERAMAALSTMVGSVVLARLADDPALSSAFLDAARRAVLLDDGSGNDPRDDTVNASASQAEPHPA
ncbi:MAG TPA: TetR/AcrR family transcriptional regulator [Rhodopila sp.]|jgi:TetR/AcrR family transcriptional repressor of nem operon|nr:TetR/AcrR family transcriptional regulator [Rhodopila sp.]